MSRNKHNQARARATRASGSSDMDIEDKLKLKKILLEDFGYDSIERDLFLCVKPDGYFEFHTSLSKDQAAKYIRIRHPDVVAWKVGKPGIIFEIDGKYHKDYDYDFDYEELGVKYCKLNKEYLEKENISWSAWIHKWEHDNL